MNILLTSRNILRKVKRTLVDFSKFRARKHLKNRDFTIISNNCTGGYVYQHYGLEYKTPTAGLLFETGDFLKICKNPRKYFSINPTIIPRESCKHYNIMKKLNRWGLYPVGTVEDIEIFFMHYPDENEAIAKWIKRCNRINYDNMVFLLTENEMCTEEHIREFCSLPIKNKVCLTYQKYDIPGAIYSEEVHTLEGHPWKPEIVCSILDWTNYLNVVSETREQKGGKA